MIELSHSPHAYVRPSPTGGMLGGLAQHTDEVVQLCEAAGYDHVIVETVGVGQSEIDVQQVCDIMLLLLPPAGGDSLQVIPISTYQVQQHI
jgi:LAO/AO transport system kinase